MVVTSATLFYACNQEEGLDITKEVPNISVKHGYLVFKDDEVFKQTIEKTKDMSREELDVWEKQFKGFTSMRSIYEKAIDEDELFFENMTEEKYNELSKISEFPHSDYVNKHKNLFVFDKNDGTFRPKMPVVMPQLYALANTNGVIKTSESLHVYTPNLVKYITDGDDKKLPMATSLTESDKSNNIVVHNYQIRKIGAAINGKLLDWDLPCGCTGKTSGGGQKVEGDIWEFIEGGAHFLGSWINKGFYIQAVNKKKNFGWHKKRTRQLRISGFLDWDIQGSYSGSYPVSVNTGGKLKKSIYTSLTLYNEFSPVGVLSPVPTITYDGSVDFYGRHGTHCNLPNDDSNCE